MQNQSHFTGNTRRAAMRLLFRSTAVLAILCFTLPYYALSQTYVNTMGFWGIGGMPSPSFFDWAKNYSTEMVVPGSPDETVMAGTC